MRLLCVTRWEMYREIAKLSIYGAVALALGGFSTVVAAASADDKSIANNTPKVCDYGQESRAANSAETIEFSVWLNVQNRRVDGHLSRGAL